MWGDAQWFVDRAGCNSWLRRPMAVYEVHLGSWARVPEEHDRWLTYREMADRLIPYVKEMGFTHIELLPVMEHPFFGSWGYQVTGFFAPTSRFGSPRRFQGVRRRAATRAASRVILDWVPGHFPKDAHGLARFDGTALYEHADPRQGEHRDWGTLIFNYGRNEVRNFLLANALFWLEEYHFDGLRVDAVASMLYLDFSKQAGRLGAEQVRRHARTSTRSISCAQLNALTHGEHPGSITVAEESTSFPGVTPPDAPRRPRFHLQVEHGLDERHARVHQAGSHLPALPPPPADVLAALRLQRELHPAVLARRGRPPARDRCGARSPGDDWQKAATLRALYGYMYAHPGKKLMFMGAEFGQHREWNHDRSLDWHLLEKPLHAGLQQFVQDLNRVYARSRRCYECDFDPAGFQWIDCNDSDNSVVALHAARAGSRRLRHRRVNFTPVPRHGYVSARRAPAATPSAEQRRRGLWRQQRRQRRLRRHRAVPAHGYRTRCA